MYNCKNCGKEVVEKFGSGVFCSRSCSHGIGKERNFETRLKISQTLKKREFTCNVCGENSDKMFGGTTRRCSKHKLKSKKDFSFEDIVKDGTRKVWLLKERGWKCERCNKETWMGDKIPLELDHIDGNPANSLKENLRLLCPNCHSQMPTHAGRNIGNHPWKEGTSERVGKKKYGSYRIPPK